MNDLTGKRVVLLLSGGQDSTTCLFWALANGASEVHALSVWYGQRHDAELRAASAVLEVAREFYPHAKLEHEQLKIGNVLASTSPLDAPCSGVSPTSVGNSVPSARRARTSRPAPMRRAEGLSWKLARWAAC